MSPGIWGYSLSWRKLTLECRSAGLIVQGCCCCGPLNLEHCCASITEASSLTLYPLSVCNTEMCSYCHTMRQGFCVWESFSSYRITKCISYSISLTQGMKRNSLVGCKKFTSKSHAAGARDDKDKLAVSSAIDFWYHTCLMFELCTSMFVQAVQWLAKWSC